MSYGERIKAARKKAGLTQQQLADKLGVSFANISQYENDKRNPKFETLLKIASAIGVSVNSLLDDNKIEAYKLLSFGDYYYGDILQDIDLLSRKIEEITATGDTEKAREYADKRQHLIALKDSIDKDIDYKILQRFYDDESRENTLKQIADILVDIDIGDIDDLIRLIEDFAYYNRSYAIENAEEIIKASFEKLNIVGINELAKRAEEYTEIPKYQRGIHIRPGNTDSTDQKEQREFIPKEDAEQSPPAISFDDL